MTGGFFNLNSCVKWTNWCGLGKKFSLLGFFKKELMKSEKNCTFFFNEIFEILDFQLYLKLSQFETFLKHLQKLQHF